MKPKPHGGKRQGAGRPKGSTRGRKKNKAVTFRVSTERHASYANAAGGRIHAAWICSALDEAVETYAKEMRPHVVRPFESKTVTCKRDEDSKGVFWVVTHASASGTTS